MNKQLENKIATIKDQLLDTSRKNRLINFKTDSSMVSRIYMPNMSRLFDLLEKNKNIDIFEIDKYIQSNTDMSDLDYLDIALKNASNNQIVTFYNSKSIHQILRKIKQKTDTYITETGINPLYICFGFLDFIDSIHTNQRCLSPIVLIPITLNSDTVISNYYVKKFEDEIIINPTLKFKLKNDYNIDIPLFDDEKYTIDSYLEMLTDFFKKYMWIVSKDMYISILSFNKIYMYHDVDDNKEDILKNDNVKQILGIENNNTPEEKIDTKLDELSFNNVLEADSSQLEAIAMAKTGKSFVLQGPPGTGKSQTITNIIAQLLSENKKVLFVSEKLAALQVVYRNLEKSDLSMFCLQLYSQKANKKDVIDDLYNTAQFVKKSTIKEENFDLDKFISKKENLDKYANLLNKNIESLNVKLFDILSEISKNSTNINFEYIISDIENKNMKYLNDTISILDMYNNNLDLFKYDYRDFCYFGYKKSSITYENEHLLKESLVNSLDILNNIFKHSSSISNILSLKIKNIERLNLVNSFLYLYFNINIFDNKIYNIKTINKLLKYLIELNILNTKYKNNLKSSSTIFNKSIYDIDILNIYNNFKNNYTSFFNFLNSDYRRDKKILLNCLNDKKLPKRDILIEQLEIVSNINNVLLEINNNKNILKNILNSNFDIVLNNIETYIEYFNSLKDILDNSFIEKLISKINDKNIEELKLYSQKNYQKILKLFKLLDKQSQIYSSSFTKKSLNLYKNDLKHLIDKTGLCIDNIKNINKWISLSNSINKLSDINYLNEYLDNKLNLNSLSNQYKYLFYSQVASNIILKDSFISTYYRNTHDKDLYEYINLDKQRFIQSKINIINNILKYIPNNNYYLANSPESILSLEAKKSRKKKPIRTLLSEIGDYIQLLKPCMLMSPLSISKFLEYNKVKFDSVIFDEASQILPSDAIVALYRSKQVIIVGDRKQMPPTNFFNTNQDISDDDDIDQNYTLSNFESILDIASATMQEKSLTWHYRSISDKLIEFSNNNFYHNKLTTFPSPYDNTFDLGIEFFKSQGVYDNKSRINHKEALDVVDLVFRHFKTSPNKSLGVVTLNISQQEYIEDLIVQRREIDNSFEKYFKTDIDEPFFVKNLETVQGDERDVIIFSIGFAKNSQGKLDLRMGPLSMEGGERRLNVAITRAKYKMIIVSSITSNDIDDSNVKNLGPKLLKSFLAFAKNDDIKSNNINTSKCSYMEDEIYNFLIEKGYFVDKNIGNSEYKITLGVKLSNSSDSKYICAIELDNKTFINSKTTRDRERIRYEQLKNRGWMYYRIWSIDWFRNKDIEKERLLDFINKSLSNSFLEKKKLDINTTKHISFNTVDNNLDIDDIDNLKMLFKSYNHTNIDYEYKRLNSISLTILEVIKKESPIHIKYLTSKMLTLIDKSVVNSKSIDIVMDYIKSFNNNLFIIKNDFIYLKENSNITLRVQKIGDILNDVRPIDYICDDELLSAINILVDKYLSIDINQLIKTISNLLGYLKSSSILKNKILKLVNELVDNNLLRLDDNIIRK